MGDVALRWDAGTTRNSSLPSDTATESILATAISTRFLIGVNHVTGGCYAIALLCDVFVVGARLGGSAKRPVTVQLCEGVVVPVFEILIGSRGQGAV